MLDKIDLLNSLIVLALLLPPVWLAYRSRQGSNAAWYVLYFLLTGSAINACLGLLYFFVAVAGFVLIGFVCRQKLMLGQFFKTQTKGK